MVNKGSTGTWKKTTLSNTHCGFWKKRSTDDILVGIEHQIWSSLVKERTTITIFFDLSQAFDTVYHSMLLYKLAKLGINGNMLN